MILIAKKIIAKRGHPVFNNLKVISQNENP